MLPSVNTAPSNEALSAMVCRNHSPTIAGPNAAPITAPVNPLMVNAWGNTKKWSQLCTIEVRKTIEIITDANPRVKSGMNNRGLFINLKICMTRFHRPAWSHVTIRGGNDYYKFKWDENAPTHCVLFQFSLKEQWICCGLYIGWLNSEEHKMKQIHSKFIFYFCHITKNTYLCAVIPNTTFPSW